MRRIARAFGMLAIAANLVAWSAGPRVEDPYESNDTRQEAYNLGAYEGVWLSEIGGYGWQNDEDWYRIEIPPGRSELWVFCTFAHYQGDIDIALHDAQGEFVTGAASETDDESLGRDQAPGVYYLRVYAYSGDTGNRYDLRWYTDLPPTTSFAAAQSVAVSMAGGWWAGVWNLNTGATIASKDKAEGGSESVDFDIPAAGEWAGIYIYHYSTGQYGDSFFSSRLVP